MRLPRDIAKVREGTYLRSYIGLDLGALLLLALEDGRGVSGDVLDALDAIWMLSGNQEMA